MSFFMTDQTNASLPCIFLRHTKLTLVWYVFFYDAAKERVFALPLPADGQK